MERVELHWCGELVGYLSAPEHAGDFISGRWLAAPKSRLAEPFIEHVARWKPWQKGEVVEFEWEGERRSGDVMSLIDRHITVRVRKRPSVREPRPPY
jgi:hypothetical protein